MTFIEGIVHAVEARMRGDFKEHSFPEVLAQLGQAQTNGALLLRREKVKKIVYFREGIPHSIKGNLLSECLGRVMVRERLISEAEYEDSLRRMMAGGKRQGAVLVEMGCISPHNLMYALQLQLKSKLFEVFSWESGDYQLNPNAGPPPETVNLEMSILAIIYEGARRGIPEERLRRMIGEVDGMFVHLSQGPVSGDHRMGLGDDERHLLDAIDQGRTVADLRGLGLLAPPDAERLLYALHLMNLVKWGAQPAETNGHFDLT